MIQILAMISMLIDHIGVVYEITFFRFIGRLAMPCYGYLLCRGCTCCHDKKLYVFRLSGLFIISQIPFYYLFGFNKLNICFVWLVSALWLFIYQYNRGVGFICLFPLVAVLLFVPCDYGVIAFGWVLLWQFGSWSDLFDQNDNKKVALIKDFLTVDFAFLLSFYDKVQFFAVLALPLVFVLSKKDMVYIKNKSLKLVYRCFYPCHMLLLKGVKLCLP